MPSTNIRPVAALLASVDWSQWAGEEVLSRGGTGVSLPAGAGLYDDLLAALHGFGARSGRSLAELADAAWTAAGGLGTLTVGIDANDRVYFECDGESITVVQAFVTAIDGVSSVSSDALGLASSTASGSGPWRVTADAEWLRYPCYLQSIRIDGGTTGAVYITSGGTDREIHQSPVAMLTGRASGDGSGAWDGLTLSDADADDSGDDKIAWALDTAGRVLCMYPSSVSAVSWTDTDFRDALGFSGTETPTTVAGAKLLRAHNLPHWALPLNRGLARCEALREQVAGAAMALDGSMGSVLWSDVATWDIDFRVSGPASPHDIEAHYLRRWLPLAQAGSGVTVYHEFPSEHRRPLFPLLNTRPTADPAYSLTRTAQSSGRRGRLVASRAPGNDTVAMTYESDLMHTSMQSMRLVERP